MLTFLLNDQEIRTALLPGATLLDFVRYHRHLNGTKVGCREGDCGACTVLVGELAGEDVRYRTMTSCLTPLANVQGKHVVTVEGINPDRNGLSAVQSALVEENGTQCGFCTVGFVLALTGYCLESGKPDVRQAIAAIDGNICRCTGYKSIERAALRLVDLLKSREAAPPLAFAVAEQVVPAYFTGIPARLRQLPPNAVAAPNGPTYLGGGTDLYVQRPGEMAAGQAAYLFDQSDLKGIRQQGEWIEIGASATVSDLLDSGLLREVFPNLRKHLALVSSTPIRNMATVAGNLVNASPIGDLSIWFLALDAQLSLTDGRQHRQVALRDFFQGYKIVNKKPEEWIEKIRFRRPGGSFYFSFEKVSKRTYLDIASVNTAVGLQIEAQSIAGAHVSIGGVAPVPLYLFETAGYLLGRPVDKSTVDAAAEVLQREINPISDVRGSAAYKRLLADRLFRAHFVELFSLA